MNTPLQLRLTEFEGPLDLLLHLIKKQEIDIYDIPIAQITTQYLAYLHNMKELQLEVAGDYLVMAATLMTIKSRLLLPKTKTEELDQDEDAADEDPRAALVEQLLAYSTYQEVSHYLGEQAQKRARFFAKEPTPAQDEVIVPLPKGLVTIDELRAALAELRQKNDQDRHFANQTINRDTFSLKRALQRVKTKLAQNQQGLTFSDLFELPLDRNQVVSLFLACLELMKDQKIDCYQLATGAAIHISRGEQG